MLLRETVEALAPGPEGLWLDGTVGAGGHAAAILEATAPGGRMLGVDRDAAALALARRHLARFEGRFELLQEDFRSLPAILDRRSDEPPRGILLDLGVSSLQLDDPRRGFSFRTEGPLDMRMDPRRGPTAADLVNTLPVDRLTRILAEYGEEPAAARIARALDRERRRAPFATTTRLASVVAGAAGHGRGRGAAGRGPGRIHPATRTFQALRIAVNEELERLDEAVRGLALRLAPGGRIAVIAFHSLEDRIVKRTFASLLGRCTCPRDLPVCACGRRGVLRLVTTRPVRPSEAEIRLNPRSRSARLRAAVRLEAA